MLECLVLSRSGTVIWLHGFLYKGSDDVHGGHHISIQKWLLGLSQHLYQSQTFKRCCDGVKVDSDVRVESELRISPNWVDDLDLANLSYLCERC